ncbi:MAG: alpha/beta hydrolase [Acidobacteria bacterium]|nr:alpha/beta hydrolase [Acidobacteriota bacterium]
MAKRIAASPPGERPASAGERLIRDRIGSRTRVLRVWQTGFVESEGRHVEYMRFGRPELRPLVWLHSIDYPMAPPWGFCVDAAERGFGVISVRRPGFGATSPVDDTGEEVRLLRAFIEEAELRDVVLVVEGTSRPAGLRLALECPQVSYTLLVRPCYVAEDNSSAAPWLRDIILQALQSRAGASLSLTALKQVVRRAGYQWLYERLHNDPRDHEFIRGNDRDLMEAWACIQAISADTFRRDLKALEPDPMLAPGCLADFRGVALTGADMPVEWRTLFLAKSESLGIEARFLPVGSFFSAYASDRDLLDLVEQRT